MKTKFIYSEEEIKELIAEAQPTEVESVVLKFTEIRDISDRYSLGHTVSAEVTLK